MAKPILPDPIQSIDTLTNNQAQSKKSHFLANRVANFYKDADRIFGHTFFSDFTEEQCLSVGRCSVRGAA